MSDWARVSALFEAVLPLDPDAREALLSRAAESPDVVNEVRALLGAHDRAGGFLEGPVWADQPDLLREDAPLVGTRVGPYRVESVVGRGGMGIVYAARDERLGRTVALKALPPHVHRDPRARERLAREARAAAMLTHPGVATVYALEEIDGDLFIASELVHGTTLREEIARGPLARDVLLDTLAQIAEALDAAHRLGIVHRDLKPENVLRDREGRVKIVDFGLARQAAASAGGLTLTGAALGTPGYMSPEQLRGQALDARADVFAFGVMAYELATGEHPFGGSDPAALVERLLSDDPPLARPIDPPALGAVIRRCLRGNPLDRYQAGAEVVAALRQVRAPASPSPARAGDAAWWWQFHQVAVAALIMTTVAIIGIRRHWLDPWGSFTFVAALVVATISVTLRLHLWFTSLVHPVSLAEVRGRSLRSIFASEGAFIVVLAVSGGSLVGPHDGTAAWLIATALLLLVSLLVIEPTTTRASGLAATRDAKLSH